MNREQVVVVSGMKEKKHWSTCKIVRKNIRNKLTG